MKYTDLEFAYEFVNAGEDAFDCRAYVSKRTGRTVCLSKEVDAPADVPEDVENNDDFIPLPHKGDLDLGTRLVWTFVQQEIPGLEEKVRSIFSRKGAYSRYKRFLDYNGILDKWHDFEEAKTKEALIAWCKEKAIPIYLEQ